MRETQARRKDPIANRVHADVMAWNERLKLRRAVAEEAEASKALI